MTHLFDTRPYLTTDFSYVDGMIRSNMGHYFAMYDRIWDSAAFAKTLDEGISRIIRKDSEDCGFYHFVIDKDFAKLNMLELDPHYQGKGIGTAVMGAIEAELLQMNIHEIRLSVYPANPALRLYTRLGYEVMCEEYPKIRMVKQL